MRAVPRICCGVLLLGTWLSAPSQASPVTYHFTTGDQAIYSLGTTPFLPDGTSVSGTFVYDGSAVASGTHANGSTL